MHASPDAAAKALRGCVYEGRILQSMAMAVVVVRLWVTVFSFWAVALYPRQSLLMLEPKAVIVMTDGLLVMNLPVSGQEINVMLEGG